MKEHEAAMRRGEIEKSAVAEHAWSKYHQPLWDETRILDCASHTTTLLIKEAMHISLRDPKELLNRDRVLTLTAAGRTSSRGAAETKRAECRLGPGDVICQLTFVICDVTRHNLSG